MNQKHPHGRGEDQEVENDADTIKETPPRAWGRLGGGASVLMQQGNTPTGVGKTQLQPLIRRYPGKHPHGRGEDWKYSKTRMQQPRNTPTGVGKT